MESYMNSSQPNREDEMDVSRQQQQPCGPLRRKRSNNKNKQDKLFICDCNKRYGSYVSWYTHFKSKHHAKDSSQQKKILKDKMLALNRQINQSPQGEQIFVQDIPTFIQEYQHKLASDKVYVEICAAWKYLKPTHHIGNIEDVIFNRFTDRVEGEMKDFQDIPRLRKEMLKKEVNHFVSQYRLEHLENSVSYCQQFNDYQIIDTKFNRKCVLNFTWDLLKYFRPIFAAKIQIILYSICHEIYNGINADQSPTLKQFKQKEWSKYTFIQPYLQQYHKSWIKMNATA